MLCLFAITLSPTGIKFVFWDTIHLCILSVIHSLRSKNGHQANDFQGVCLDHSVQSSDREALDLTRLGYIFGPIKSVRR